MVDRKPVFHNPLHHERDLPAKRILVPINGEDTRLKPSSLEALNIACNLAHIYHKSEITLVHVVEVPRNLRIDKEMPDQSTNGNKLLDYAQEILEGEQIVNVRGNLLQVRAGGLAHAILDEARDIDANMIIIGTSGIDEFNVRHVTPLIKSIMDHSSCEVVLVRASTVKLPPRSS